MSGAPRPPRVLRRAGGVFLARHAALMGAPIDFARLDLTRHPPELVTRARATWHQRFTTELRSIQIMNRFVAEVVAAGDPLEVYAGAVELVADEVRHMALCAELVTALGGALTLPEPPEIVEPPAFRDAPAPERALATALSMLAVNETLSVAYITDLRDRCPDPVVYAVLAATVADEAEHEGFGWAYIERALARFPSASLPVWRDIVASALAPSRAFAEPVLARLPPERRTLEAWPDAELVPLGLFSAERQALLYDRCARDTLAPRLRALGLWPDAG